MRGPLKNRKLEEEARFTTSRSSGAGGQHVNKTETSVALRFNVDASERLNIREKKRINKQLKNQINNSGELIVHCEETRSQAKNKERAIEKFYERLQQALKPRKKRIKTRPPKSAKEKRIKQKKKRSDIKQIRRKDNIR